MIDIALPQVSKNISTQKYDTKSIKLRTIFVSPFETLFYEKLYKTLA